MISGPEHLKYQSSKEGSGGASFSCNLPCGCTFLRPELMAMLLASFFAQAKGTLFSLIDMFSGGIGKALSLRPWHYALYQRFDHSSASHRSHPLSCTTPERRRVRPKKDRPIYSLRNGSSQHNSGIWDRRRLGEYARAAGEMIVMDPGWSFRIMTVITLTAGTAFIMWLGEQITERGIGNGISLIIFAGIVARMQMP